VRRWQTFAGSVWGSRGRFCLPHKGAHVHEPRCGRSGRRRRLRRCAARWRLDAALALH